MAESDDSSVAFVAGLLGSPVGGGIASYLFSTTHMESLGSVAYEVRDYSEEAGVMTTLAGWAVTLCYEGFVKDKNNAIAQILGSIAAAAAAGVLIGLIIF